MIFGRNAGQGIPAAHGMVLFRGRFEPGKTLRFLKGKLFLPCNQGRLRLIDFPLLTCRCRGGQGYYRPSFKNLWAAHMREEDSKVRRRNKGVP